jgi:hypothetical protein
VFLSSQRHHNRIRPDDFHDKTHMSMSTLVTCPLFQQSLSLISTIGHMPHTYVSFRLLAEQGFTLGMCLARKQRSVLTGRRSRERHSLVNRNRPVLLRYGCVRCQSMSVFVNDLHERTKSTARTSKKIYVFFCVSSNCHAQDTTHVDVGTHPMNCHLQRTRCSSFVLRSNVTR